MNSTMRGWDDAGRVSLRWRAPRFFLLMVAAWTVFAAFALAIFLPEASNEVVYKDGGAVVDASHSDQGYIMVKRTSKKAQKAILTLGKEKYTYDLRSDGEFEVFPLQMGDGKYKLEVFEHISGKKYSPVSALGFSVTLGDEFAPYLYPSQYVWYTADCETVKKGQEICAGAATDAEKVGAVYQFMLDNFIYDYVQAATVQKQKGYIPSVDDVLGKKKGICFDFSVVVATMLRSEGIPVQMAIGYADKAYHAWNNIYIDGKWYRYDVTSDICGANVKSYTTERIY